MVIESGCTVRVDDKWTEKAHPQHYPKSLCKLLEQQVLIPFYLSTVHSLYTIYCKVHTFLCWDICDYSNLVGLTVFFSLQKNREVKMQKAEMQLSHLCGFQTEQ